MKRFVQVLLLVTLMAVAVSAQSYDEATKPVSFQLGAGIGWPLGDFGDVYGLGLHAKLGVGFNIASVPGLTLVPTAEFHTWKLDEDEYIAEFDLGDAEIDLDLGATNMVLVGANARYAIGAADASVMPFITGGAGAAFVMFGEVRRADAPPGWVSPWDEDPDNVTKFYFNAGGGFEFAAGETMTIFVEARYLGIPEETVDFNFVPITVGLRF